MQAEIIIAMVMLFIMRGKSKLRPNFNTQKNIFNGLLIIVFGLIALDFNLLSELYTRWVAFSIIAYLIYTTYKDDFFKNWRVVSYSVIPFLTLRISSILLRFVFPDFYNSYDSYIASAIGFSILWIIGMAILHSRQKKARLKEEKERILEEEKKRVLELRKQQLEVLVNERTAEITHQKEELQFALEELKNTQTQLIHHEKMASLGELTAGIAHEIQNPLNFVNNFSEVSIELLDEMQEELAKNNLDDVTEIVNDIKQNLAKIAQHGKRADSIVKGMLQHSRTTTGEKVATNINSLADEYLRLSYHGLRAKNKNFNATTDVDFDESIQDIAVIPQDIGRVLLNLLNNAFYSVTEKKKTAGDDYKPTVTVSTKKLSTGVEIRVKDNGVGIPDAVMAKIYQPFFTTKPTGEGTGLGLSMSYDIMTKAHNGKLEAFTKENEFAEFVLFLPA
jgi:signal transduction histidine kinase